MLNSLYEWLDSRTGIKKLLYEGLYENIPSGARWRYISGSMLVFAFAVQAITGVILWMCYSPSSQTAYESVYYIQHEMAGGWLLRGIHHFMAQAMIVVLALHLLQVVVDAAYRAPREVNFWLGLVLLKIVLGLSLTGYLLPWDQKGYWATNVATNLATLVPVVGKQLQQLAVGGSEYGHHTLTRFFAMHTGVLPALLVGFLALHISVFRKHGITAKITPGRPDQYFWPHQVFMDAVGCVVLLVLVVGFTIHWDFGGVLSGNLPAAHRGAELGAPADPAEAYSAARPEWYFLFLFQLLKYFHGTQEIIGALIIPGILFTGLVAMPIVGRTRAGHYFNVAFIIFLLAGAAGLTAAALSEDYYASLAPKFGWKTKGTPAVEKLMISSQEFIQAKHEAEHSSQRMHELIQARVVEGTEKRKLGEKQLIPRLGAVYLLRNDPGTRGPVLFKQHCASCHSYQKDPQPQGNKTDTTVSAPNLYGFATRDWIRGLLDPERIASSDYFGNTAHANGRMAEWVKAHGELLKDDPKSAEDDGDAIAAALSAQARLKRQFGLDTFDEKLIAKGVTLINQNCAKGCHRFGDEGQLGLAPDLTGYGSYEWMLGFLSDPAHERFYRRENDRMPSFAKDLERPATNTVSPRELSLIVDWIRGEYFQAEDMLDAAGKLKDEDYYATHPRDLFPVLPHNEEEARAATRLARLTSEPRGSVVGAAVPAAIGKRQQAEQLFVQNCRGCHSHINEQGLGIVSASPSAPNLFGFASRAWLSGLLDPKQIAGPAYFGQTKHAEGEMAGFVKDNLTDLNDSNKKALADIVSALSAEAVLPGQKEVVGQEQAAIEQGRTALTTHEFSQGGKCADCHSFGDAKEGSGGPLLSGYGSRAWLVKFLTQPNHADFYGKGNDRMPAFGVGTGPKKSLLNQAEIELLTDWLRGEKLE